ncbi:MAG: hypothetical protein ACRDTN_21525 [Mycobacterium sp.]
MSELPEPTTTPASAGTTQPSPPQKPYWLYRFAAWVVIVAGIVFVASTIFFAGAYVSHGGWHGYHHHHHHHHSMMHHGHHHHRGAGSDTSNPSSPGPSQPPESTTPSLTPPGR